MTIIPKSIKTEASVFRSFTMNDAMVVMGTMSLGMFAGAYVHRKLEIVITLFSIIIGIFLVLPSTKNPNKRMYYLIFRFLTKDERSYNAVTTDEKVKAYKDPKDYYYHASLDEDLIFTRTDGTYCKYLTIDGISVDGMSDLERSSLLMQYSSFIKLYRSDYREYTMTFPISLEKQIEFNRSLLEKTDNPQRIALIQEEMDMFQRLVDNHVTTTIYILELFNEDYYQLVEDIKRVKKLISSFAPVRDASEEELLLALNKLYNMNVKL